MIGVKFHRASACIRSSTIAALAIALAYTAMTIPAWADPLAAGGATVAGTAAMAPQHQSTVVPGSLDREQPPEILTVPALPTDPSLHEARPDAHPPSAADLKLGVPLRCEDPAGFFPHVAACRLAWRAITPIVPAVIAPEAPRARTVTVAAPAIVPAAPPAAPALAGTAEAERHQTQPVSASSASTTSASVAVSTSAALLAAPPPPAKEVAPRATPPKRAKAPEAPAPQPPRAVAVALPATARVAPEPAEAPPAKAAEAPHQELAAAVSDVPPKPNRGQAALETGWTVPREAGAGAVLTAQSKQAAKDGGAFALVEAACNTRNKQFSLRAALVDGAGSAIIPLTERMQIGDTAMQPAYFHTELAFNKLVLTSGYGGAAISEASANVLLAAKQALYEIRTNDGTVLIKLAAADANLRKVLQACQSRD
jgi:hypothetical protein